MSITTGLETPTQNLLHHRQTKNERKMNKVIDCYLNAFCQLAYCNFLLTLPLDGYISQVLGDLRVTKARFAIKTQGIPI